MRIPLALAAVSLSLALAPAASAAPVERCTPGEAGRVLTVGDLTLALCAQARWCPGWLGVYATVDGEEVIDTCTSAHIDEWFSQGVCAVLAGFAPGIPGVVDIGSDGDLSVDGYPVWECPPYGW